MPYLTAAAYVAAYFTLIAWLVVLSAGYSGKSAVLDISSWQDCRKLVRCGWMIFGFSYMLIATAIVLNQAYLEEQWGWIYVSCVIFWVGLLIGPVVVMSGKQNNPHVPS